MRNLIVPFAGKSSRYKTPKFLLKGKNEFPMVFESIKGLPIESFDRIIFVYQRHHEKKYNFVKDFKNIIKYNKKFKSIELFELNEITNSPCETICKVIGNLNLKGNLFIKDCDDYFSIKTINPNEVAFYSLNDMGLVNAANKSYIKMNSNNIISTIVEKNVISPFFCCGLYSFTDTSDFCKTYQKIDTKGEIYVSHIIYKKILDGEIFKGVPVNDYIDWGTEIDWKLYSENN